MSVQSVGHCDEDPYEVIHLGGETAVVVPIEEYRRLRALERLASPEELEHAEAVLQEHREWAAAGRPGVVSHEDAMAELQPILEQLTTQVRVLASQ